MYGKKGLGVLIISLVNLGLCTNQVVLFGNCAELDTVKFFDVENFLGLWYEIERFPTWYDRLSRCAYKRFQACGRRIEVEHGFIRDDVRFVLHVNSSYAPGDDAIFEFKKNNIDPFGIPLTVVSTDYANYAVTYGCSYNASIDIKYISAQILSRDKFLAAEILAEAYQKLNSLPNVSTVYLERVEQDEDKCSYYWTAHVNAEEEIEENDELRCYY